ncbi:hypothetical protein CDD83_7689 [Cordyceps sp. RAO-2017]|nr:hypothetical protein CDD83_7689 [Cordyceps sp. RAO-2017]
MSSVNSLERDWGPRWRVSAKKTDFSTRKVTVDEFQKRPQMDDLAEDIVARQMDEERGFRSLDKLFKAIRKGKESERETAGVVCR